MKIFFFYMILLAGVFAPLMNTANEPPKPAATSAIQKLEVPLVKNKSDDDDGNAKYWQIVLAGVLGLIAGTANTYFQNKHSRLENKIQREFDLKRQTFSNAIESITEANQLLIQIPSLTIDELNKRFAATKFGTTITQLKLTAKIEIIKEIAAYQTAFSEKWLSLVWERRILDSYNLKLHYTSRELDEHSKIFYEEINRMRAMPNATDPLYKASLAKMDSVHERMKPLYGKQGDLINLIDEERLRLNKLCIEALRDFGPSLNEALILAREDLGISIDADVFKKIENDSLNRNTNFLSQFIEKVENEIRNRKPEAKS